MNVYDYENVVRTRRSQANGIHVFIHPPVREITVRLAEYYATVRQL